MKAKLQFNIFFSVILLMLGINSCRGVDTDNTLNAKLAHVKINLTGTEFASADTPTPTASIKSKEILDNRLIQSQTFLVTPSSIITAELTPFREPNIIASSSKKINTIAAISGNPIAAGMKFRVIAYLQSDGAYAAYQDYTVGQTAEPLTLQTGTTYIMVIYSYGANTLPVIGSSELINISGATVNYDDINRDFMYQKISFTPDGNSPNNTLNITLRHKLTQINMIINSTIGDINSVTNAIIGPHYTDGTYSLANGTIAGRNTNVNQNVIFSSTLPSTTAIADPILINADTAGNKTGSFSASVNIGGVTKMINLSNFFIITPERKNNLTIRVRGCGAYIAPGVWKDFACHNLGADTNADPYIPAASIQGAKYQWGYSTPVLTQSQDQANSGSITGWNTAAAPDNSWNATGGPQNPCPTGYHVPSITEWQSVIANNEISRLGLWTDDSPTNYGTAIKFGSNLLLPGAGFRALDDGTLNNRGKEGDYWTSTNNVGTANFLVFGGTALNEGSQYLNYGYSVRCVKD